MACSPSSPLFFFFSALLRRAFPCANSPYFCQFLSHWHHATAQPPRARIPCPPPTYFACQSTVTEPTPGSKQSSLTPPQHSAGNPASRAVRSRQLSAYYRNILFSPPSLTSAIYSSLSHTRSFSDFSTLWNILYSRFFSQVNVPLDTISSYESSLIKLYLSSCYEAGDIEACRRFFEEHGGGWGRQNFQIGAWRQWFSLCYMKNAKDDQVSSIRFYFVCLFVFCIFFYNKFIYRRCVGPCGRRRARNFAAFAAAHFCFRSPSFADALNPPLAPSLPRFCLLSADFLHLFYPSLEVGP